MCPGCGTSFAIKNQSVASSWPFIFHVLMETCRSYDKMCIRCVILTLEHLLVLLCEIYTDIGRWMDEWMNRRKEGRKS